MNKKNANSFSLVAILLVSIVPLGLAIIMYFMQWGVPINRTNQGLLLSPPAQWQDLDAKMVSAADYADAGANWVLLVKPDKQCNEGCMQSLHTLRQVHLALGKEAHRVGRTLVLPATGSVDSLTTEYPNMHTVQIGNASVFTQGAGVYLVDPIGNIMMYYTFEQIGKPMLKDLKKLLRTSNIG